MHDLELISIVNAEIRQGYNSTDGNGETMHEIAKGLKYYLGEPLGNEEEGQSQVISRDVKNIVEAMLPSLIRIFASTDKAVEFMPVGPEDEDAAKQETDLINHVFYKECNGFFITYSWFKDALLSKNGILKVWWDDEEISRREEYFGLDDNAFQILLADDELEPLEHTENEDFTHDLVVRRTTTKGKPRIEVIPIEEFIISKDGDSIFPEEARFTCHKTTKTRSELIASGFDKDVIMSLATVSPGNDTDEISIQRDHNDDDEFGEEAKDDSLQEIEVYECYMKVDYDGDGIAELRQVTKAGNEILVNEEIDENPFVAITPIILTHKFFGLSIADDSMDIQLIKSTLLRGILNNMYEANNRTKYYQSGMVNLDDLLVSRPNRVVETAGPPSSVIMEAPPGQLPPQVFDVMDRMDQERKERTGVGQEFFGLESNVLAHGRTGVVNQAFDAARMKVELIARIFAEVGMKPLFLKLHGLLQKHQDKKKTVRIRGKWVDVSPREWKVRENMTINVGLGTGNKDREIQNLMMIAGMQEKLLPGGLGVTPQNIYNTLEKLVEASGFRDVSLFFTDPSTQQPPPEKPDPQIELLKLQQQIEQAKIEVDKINAETKRMQVQQEGMIKQKDLLIKDKDIDLEDERERTKLEIEAGRNIPGAAI